MRSDDILVVVGAGEFQGLAIGHDYSTFSWHEASKDDLASGFILSFNFKENASFSVYKEHAHTFFVGSASALSEDVERGCFSFLNSSVAVVYLAKYAAAVGQP